ncbi:cell envelope integrity protein TolA [Pseudanabaena sp. FACHB-2040]|uniref:cell envelope integrity protein TolA n=1 Tax=Pseudanabaena sp. FACHB-2040 TaxID=2692859 RepID=UPI0016888504|nr:cell envelope integrity protein TolA [Pseudanabaena sp. FACHB-2040]MBD2260675.1 cell envelope integrity protein TolA [Pseudanabaena sp. FACHB-2040]
MASPFRDYQSFNEATGPIYTFSDRPVVIALLLVASVLIFLYFIYSSFNIRKGESQAKNPIILSILLATTAFAAAEAIYQQVSGKQSTTQAQVSQPAEERTPQPLALLGMVGLGGAASRRPRTGRRLKRLSR